MTSEFPTILAGRHCAVVDVEGNGQQPPEIIEIAILPVDGPVTVDAMRTWLVKPTRPVTPIVTRKVHGITNGDLAECPRWHEIADDINQLLAGRILIAHNAAVERRVLATHLPDWNPPLILDTLRLAKTVWRGLPSFALDELIDRGHLDTSAAEYAHHRAGFDAWAAWQLLCALIEDGELAWEELVAAAGLPEFAPTPQPEGGLW